MVRLSYHIHNQCGRGLRYILTHSFLNIILMRGTTPPIKRKPRSRPEKRRREFLTLLRWVELENKQVELAKYWNKQRGRWNYWQYLDQHSIARRPGLTEDMTGTNSAEVYAWRKSFKYVRRMRYIEVRKQGNRLVAALTDLGRKTLLRHAIARAPTLPKPWIILVIFDIPEDTRDARDLLRAFLKEHGFKQLQQSAWYNTHDLQEPLETFLASLHLTRWVNVMRAQCPLLRH